MMLKKCDFFSPHITLYFKGENIHSLIFSGILSIISYSIIFAFGIYYSLNYVYKINPDIYHYTKYIEDAGIFPLNSSSLFHFIHLGNTLDLQHQNIDFESVRIFGFKYTIDNYISNNNLSRYEHWLYGPCYINDTKNIEDIIINKEFPQKSACIRQYYDINNHKYYNTSEDNFKWPELLHGTANVKTSNYGIILEKCRNDSLKNNCKSESEIDSYIEHSIGILYFVDNIAQIKNYTKPYSKYLYTVTNGFFSNSLTINNLNFNPSLTTDNYGAFINHQDSFRSYQFTQNEKTSSKNSNNTNIILSFYFWMQNSLLCYERNYEKLQDLLSNIGGLESFVKFIAYIINSFIINYRILLDTEELVLNSDKQNFQKCDINQKPTFLKKASQILNPPKLKNNKNINKNSINNKNHSSIFQIILKDKSDESDIDKFKKLNNIDSKSEPFYNIYFKKKQELDLNKKLTNKNLGNDSLYFSNSFGSSKKDNLVKNSIDSKSMIVSINNKVSINKLKTKKMGENFKPLKKQNFSWFNYFSYMITCKLTNPKISYYEIFRKEVISEENIIQNHINIFKLLKECKIENLDPFQLKNIESSIC